MSDWVELGAEAEIPPRGVVLRKDGEGRRYAVFRADGAIQVLDDRCPHEGYPLSQGELRDGVLTCAWHNWKFDGCSGDCVFGGEAVRRYPVRIERGRVLIDPAIDAVAERTRLLASMGRTLREVDVTSALRDALRLSALAGDGGGRPSAFAAVVADGARRAPWGFDHPLAMTADLARWAAIGWVDADAALSLAITAVAEECAHLEVREVPRGALPPGAPESDLEEERREMAEARVRVMVKEEGAAAAAKALVPFVASHLLDYGHGAIYLAKAFELAQRFPEAAEDLFGALTHALGWATRETGLPPWAATRQALAAVEEANVPIGSRRLAGDARRVFEEAILRGERPGVEAAVALLAEGFSPLGLIWAAARAGAHRVRRFDGAWERRRDSNATVLNVTHVVTFAEACIALSPLASPAAQRRLAIQAVGFVGKVRKGDATSPPEATASERTLASALEARDLPAALGAVRGATPEARARAFTTLASFAAFDMAVRPIRYAHGIKMTESLHRLSRDETEPDPIYLEALLAYVVPRRPERDHRRFAEVARRFLSDGRPPPGLY